MTFREEDLNSYLDELGCPELSQLEQLQLIDKEDIPKVKEFTNDITYD